MRVCVALTARPSYAKLKTVIAALVERQAEVLVVACGSALLERYGRVVDVVRRDFPSIQVFECWSTYEGSTLVTSAKETGALLTELASVFHQMRPAAVLVTADRHEVLAVAQAASYLHIRLIHQQGGESSGSIDDKVRNAITALADVHCVCTEQAHARVDVLTSAPGVHLTGCPSIDLAKEALSDPPVTIHELGGAGPTFDLAQPFLLVLQHPVTNEMDQAFAQMTATMDACARISLPRLVIWPGQDAGMEATSKAIRTWISDHPSEVWHTVRNLPPQRFLRLLAQCSVLVGNSSAGIREASYLGTPVVNVGTRQVGRERAVQVCDVVHEVDLIEAAIRCQLACGRYDSSPLYGTGEAGRRIAEVICGGDCTDTGTLGQHGHSGEEHAALR
jgi:UDP-hydrolysing UDP-N-acetyl-D-glucosamine 2-epimerase